MAFVLFCQSHGLQLLICGGLPDFYSSADVGMHNFSLLTSILRTPHDRQTRSLIFTAHLQYPSMPQPLSASLRSTDLMLDWGFVLNMAITEACQHKQRRKTRREWGNQRLLSDFMVDWERHQLSVALSLSMFITFGTHLHQLWPLNISMLKSLVLLFRFFINLKDIKSPKKMKIVSSFSHTHVLPNPYVIYYYFKKYFFVNLKRRISEESLHWFFKFSTEQKFKENSYIQSHIYKPRFIWKSNFLSTEAHKN